MNRTERPCRPTTVEGTTRRKVSDQELDGWLYATHNADVLVYAGNPPRTAAIVRRDGSTAIARIDAGTQWALRQIAWLTVELEQPTETLARTVDRTAGRATA